MNAEQLLEALSQLAESKNIPFETLAQATAEGLRAMVIAELPADDAYVAIDLDAAELEIEAVVGDRSELLSLDDLSRRMADGVKRVISQAVVKAQAAILEEIAAPFVGTVVEGRINQVAEGAATVDLVLGGQYVEGILHPSEATGARLVRNHPITVLIRDQVDISSVPRIRLTRRAPEFVAGLLARAVPAIASGQVEIVSIAREPGVRTKVRVISREPNIDPVAVVIGAGGKTIAPVIEDVAPERIDVVGPGTFDEVLRAALMPGRIIEARVYEPEGKSPLPVVRVSTDQKDRPLLFGRDGHNLRLASQLLGVRILVVDEFPPGEIDPSLLPASA